MKKKYYHFREVQENPSIIWDNLESVGVNILANLGLIPEGPNVEIQIIDKHGKVLSSTEQKKRFSDYANNIKRKHDNEVAAIQRIILSTSSEGELLSLSPDDYISVELPEATEKESGEAKSSIVDRDSLPGGIEQIFGRLHNLTKAGSLDHLYAIIEFALQRSTNIAAWEHSDIQDSTDELVKELGEDFADKTTAAKLHGALEENLERLQIEELKLLIEFSQLERMSTKKKQDDKADAQPVVADNANLIALYDGKIAYLDRDNKRLAQLVQSMRQEKEKQQEKAPAPEKPTAVKKRWDEWFEDEFSKLTGRVEKLLDVTVTKPVDSDARTYIDLLRQQINQRKAANEALEAKCITLEMNIELKEKLVVRKKARRTELVTALGELDHQLFELATFPLPGEKSEEAHRPHAGAKVKVEIPVEGDKKKFGWDLELGLSGNLTRLLDDYLKSPGYHTWGRKKSANAVLKKIDEIIAADKDPFEQDLEILKIIRAETKKISSHGGNGQASQLFAIYTQAELRFRERIRKEVAESKELNSKNKEKAPLLIELKERVESEKKLLARRKRRVEAKKADSQKAEEPAPLKESSPQDVGQLDAKAKEHEAQIEKNRVLRVEYVGFAAEALQKELFEVERELEQVKQQEVTINARLKEAEGKYTRAETELATIQAETEDLEKHILIRYLEVSQRARELGQLDLFGEKRVPQNNEYTLLPRLVNSFIDELKKRLGWGKAAKEEPARPKDESKPATALEPDAEPDAFDRMLEQIAPPARRK